MKRNKSLKAFSNWVLDKKNRKKNQQISEHTESKGLSFVSDTSGYRAIPYSFSNQYHKYIDSYQHNLKQQLKKMNLDQLNKDFKKLELLKIRELELEKIESQYEWHIFVNKQIVSQLKSHKQLFEEQLKLLDMQDEILKRSVDDETV